MVGEGSGSGGGSWESFKIFFPKPIGLSLHPQTFLIFPVLPRSQAPIPSWQWVRGVGVPQGETAVVQPLPRLHAREHSLPSLPGSNPAGLPEARQ
jgi:hypothetical protein